MPGPEPVSGQSICLTCPLIAGKNPSSPTFAKGELPEHQALEIALKNWYASCPFFFFFSFPTRTWYYLIVAVLFINTSSTFFIYFIFYSSKETDLQLPHSSQFGRLTFGCCGERIQLTHYVTSTRMRKRELLDWQRKHGRTG